MFGFDKDKWIELNGYNTASEIYRQPKLWLETVKIIESSKDSINRFMKERLDKDKLRVIFTGAGTSAYVGEIVISRLNKEGKYIYEAIPTTHIVADPEAYFKKDIPTILVSFARSGNSPESVAAYNLANKLIDDISHVFITCNKRGKLVNISKHDKNVLLLLMPEESNDKGFAMTSSFSCMTLAASLIFDIANFDTNKEKVNQMVSTGRNVLDEGYNELNQILNYDYSRVVYLGSGSFYGLAKESALKLLELTRGKIISLSESVLGFRHGPKSIVDDNTLIFVFVSGDPYTRKYDLDLLNEICQDGGRHKVIAISGNYYKDIENSCHHYISLNKGKNDIDNTAFTFLLFALYAQVFALLSSVKTKIEPDNPSPGGLVNRVVKGVIIHEY